MLQKSLRRFDMLSSPSARWWASTRSVRCPGSVPQTFAWVVILAVAFLLPYALVMAELGTTFTQEGGPYEWMKMAGAGSPGRSGLGALLGHEPALGRRLARVPRHRRLEREHPRGRLGTRSATSPSRCVFIWISISVAIVSLRRGKWIPNVGALVRVGVLGFFSVTVLIYAIEHGVHGYAAGDFGPTDCASSSVSCRCCSSTTSASSCRTGRPRRCRTRRRDVPVTVIQGGIVAALAYSSRSSGSWPCCPTSKISGIGGFLDAVHTTFGVYGGAPATS